MTNNNDATTSRYPQDSNIIDFIEIKLSAMAESYAGKGHTNMAEALWNALDQYANGNINIIFKNGDPYVVKAHSEVSGSSEKKE